ncbi:TPA: undecaprenyl-diphosphate phosphatase [Candidatus Scatousia excrementigallinarum]|uniref:Undecaprenyl-diphosphatase n=1 Tax=Candidatus Scatousia excrementigallinarum TaxID=2840935 RepID=A0A9D1JP17_9BACT|nr:undecaprenyl-diphosphate phosphatase [Candidatus Scatousia excrementigallinarum]
MNLIQAILMGIVQGLSEFLPISSSAHLVFTSNFYKVFANIPIHEQSGQEVFFDIMVHLGTLIAVLIFFRKDIMNILKSMFKALKSKDWSDNEAKLGLYIIVGTFLTICVALPLHDVAEKLVFSPAIVGGLLFITGFVLLYSEYVSKHVASRKENIDWKTSILIGLAQGIAAMPGFSRSGWTIATGLFAGLDRTTAARYSFLLSIPIILGASMVYPFVKLDFHEVAGYNWSAIIAGTLVSGIVGYLCIKYFMKFISRFSLAFFGYYCIIAGIATAVFFAVYK